MQRLFWAQNENPNTPNTLINETGAVFAMGQQQDGEAQDLFDSLLSLQDTSKKVYQEGNLLIKKHPQGGFFISSNFTERDEANRQMGFMFFTPKTTGDGVLADLYFFSNRIKRNLTEADKVNIQKELESESPAISKGIIIALAIVLIIIVIIIITYTLWRESNQKM